MRIPVTVLIDMGGVFEEDNLGGSGSGIEEVGGDVGVEVALVLGGFAFVLGVSKEGVVVEEITGFEIGRDDEEGVEAEAFNVLSGLFELIRREAKGVGKGADVTIGVFDVVFLVEVVPVGDLFSEVERHFNAFGSLTLNDLGGLGEGFFFLSLDTVGQLFELLEEVEFVFGGGGVFDLTNELDGFLGLFGGPLASRQDVGGGYFPAGRRFG